MADRALVPADETTTSIRALDATTGEKKWEYKMVGDSWTGDVVTAGGLGVFGRCRGEFLRAQTQTPVEPLRTFVAGIVRAIEPRVLFGRRQRIRCRFSGQLGVRVRFALGACDRKDHQRGNFWPPVPLIEGDVKN